MDQQNHYLRSRSTVPGVKGLCKNVKLTSHYWPKKVGCCPRERKINASSAKFTTVQITTSQGPIAYSVIATVEHIGLQISSGHYVAHIIKHGNWFRCDDTNIQKVDDHTPTKKPYLLILKKSD